MVYLDETGSSGRGARTQQYFTLAAVVVDEAAVQPLADRMRALAMTHLGWVPADFEFHGAVLWNGTGHWGGKTPTELLAAFESVIGLLQELDIYVVHATIDKHALHQRYGGTFDRNAYILALQFLLEKLDRYRTNQVRRILIADEAKEHELRAVKLVKDMQQWTVGEVPGRQLVSIIDSIHFVDSTSSPGVQLADMVAFILHRAGMGTHVHPDAAAAIGRMRAIVDAKTPTWRAPWP